MDKNNLMQNIIKAPDFEIINNANGMAKIYPVNESKPYTGTDSNYLILDFGEKNRGDLVEANFTFKSSKHKITSTTAGCGCTQPRFENQADGTQLVVVKFDSAKVTRNVNKAYTLVLDGGKLHLRFMLVINKS